MLRKILPLLLSLCLILSSCGSVPQKEEGNFHIVATTYPVYLFASEVTRGVSSVSVTLLVDQPVSCLHDYTLSVKDMKTLEQADVVLLNGAGLEESMAATLATLDSTPQLDTSHGVTLLEGSHSDHSHEDGKLPAGHEQEADPHIWLDPLRACQMMENIAQGLGEQDPDNATLYHTNATLAIEQIRQAYTVLKPQLENLPCREMIPFHDGFSYFADAFGLTVLTAIEEEAGSEASAKEVATIVAEIKEHQIPAIFTEVNGADATAQLIHQECGVPIYTLDLMMHGKEGQAPGVSTYLELLQANVDTLREAYT